MNRAIAILMLALSTPAHAQQQPSPMEQALSQKLITEINAALQCSASLVTAQGQLQAAQAQARVKELEPKEPKPPVALTPKQD
jgi:hypothetical protein